ncbi:partial Signal transduction histidine-protein kinase BarA, partial [Candidatus Brocadiaceae bacterium]
IPIYVVSAREKDAALIQQGILGYLQKPVDVKQISEAEAELLAFIQQTAAQVILVVENGSITTEQLSQLIINQNIVLLKMAAHQDINQLSLNSSCCLAIIDLGTEVIDWALELAKTLKTKNPAMNFVFLGQTNLSDEDQARIRHYSDSIIIKAPQSEQRLLKNIERFLTKTTHHTNDVIVPESGHRLIGRHILVVDDDTRNLFVITSALEKEGAKVNGVLNGKRALEFLQQHKVNMVFMDIMMPEMDGYQTIKIIRDNADLAHLAIVALTAKALSSDREKALAVGADDYLAKPVEYEVLINTAMVWCEHQHKS